MSYQYQFTDDNSLIHALVLYSFYPSFMSFCFKAPSFTVRKKENLKLMKAKDKKQNSQQRRYKRPADTLRGLTLLTGQETHSGITEASTHGHEPRGWQLLVEGL